MPSLLAFDMAMILFGPGVKIASNVYDRNDEKFGIVFLLFHRAVMVLCPFRQ
jgi:hypothetical protein